MSKQDQCFFAEVHICITQIIFKFLPMIPTRLRSCLSEEMVQVVFRQESDRLEIAVTVLFLKDRNYPEGLRAFIGKLMCGEQDCQPQAAKDYLHFISPLYVKLYAAAARPRNY